MELAAALRGPPLMIDLVETVGPVDTHQTHHRQEDAHTDTCRALDVEGVEVLGLVPGITALEESESVDGGVAQHEGIAQLQREAVVGIGIVRVV